MDMAPNERNRLQPQEEEKDSVLDNLIDLLPFEMHVPGYKFCGPGTNKEMIRGAGPRFGSNCMRYFFITNNETRVLGFL